MQNSIFVLCVLALFSACSSGSPSKQGDSAPQATPPGDAEKKPSPDPTPSASADISVKDPLDEPIGHWLPSFDPEKFPKVKPLEVEYLVGAKPVRCDVHMHNTAANTDGVYHRDYAFEENADGSLAKVTSANDAYQSDSFTLYENVMDLFEYDALGRLTKLTQRPVSNDSTKIVTTYTYNSLGLWDTTVADTGRGSTYTNRYLYNSDGQLVHQTYTEASPEGDYMVTDSFYSWENHVVRTVVRYPGSRGSRLTTRNETRYAIFQRAETGRVLLWGELDSIEFTSDTAQAKTIAVGTCAAGSGPGTLSCKRKSYYQPGGIADLSQPPSLEVERTSLLIKKNRPKRYSHLDILNSAGDWLFMEKVSYEELDLEQKYDAASSNYSDHYTYTYDDDARPLTKHSVTTGINADQYDADYTYTRHSTGFPSLTETSQTYRNAGGAISATQISTCEFDRP